MPFSDIQKYREGWRSGLPETACGYGSKLSQTEKQREIIPKIIDEYNIKSILDIGAGDLNWIDKTDLGGAEYSPVDLVPRDKRVAQFDVLKQIPPKVDMIMCFWVLNHMPKETAAIAWANIMASGSKYLLTTYRPKWEDKQITAEGIEFPIDNGDIMKLITI